MLPVLPAFAACLPAESARPVEVATITDQAEIVLADGHSVIPAGIAFRDEAAAAAAIRTATAAYPLYVAALAKQPDRWGRYAGGLYLETPAGRQSLAEQLVGAGLAFVVPEAVSDKAAALLTSACASHLLMLEKRARAGKSGSWGGPDAMPLNSAHSRDLQRFQGQFVVVEGEVISIGERRNWTFLNFGRDWQRDFSVMIARRDWQAMERDGISAATLRGKRVTVRGILQVRDDSRISGNGNTGRAPMIKVSVSYGLAIEKAD